MSSVLNATASNVDHFNASGIQNADDLSFTMKSGSRQSFDMNFSNLMASDQSMVLMLKEAFQCYLKKDEVKSRSKLLLLVFIFILLLYFSAIARTSLTSCCATRLAIAKLTFTSTN